MILKPSKAIAVALATLVGLCLPALSLSLDHHGRTPEHHHANRRLHLPPEPRGNGNRFTWYDAGEGIGACGKHSSGNQLVVALSHLDWDNGAHCGKTISIQIGAHTAQAKVVDECMGCAKGDLDFSHSLFAIFGSPEILGILHGSWHLGEQPSHHDKPKHAPGKAPDRKPHQHLQAKHSSSITAHKHTHTPPAASSKTSIGSMHNSRTSAYDDLSSSFPTSSASTSPMAIPTTVEKEEKEDGSTTSRIRRALRGMGRLASNATEVSS